MKQVALVSSRLIYMGAILDVLRLCGGTAKSKEVYEILIAKGVARKGDITTIQKSGERRFSKEVRFARKELVEAGLLANDVEGIWSLSEHGWGTCLDPDTARK